MRFNPLTAHQHGAPLIAAASVSRPQMLRSALRLSSKAPQLALGRVPGAPAALTRAHCQVPCGIFDDPVRVTLLKEDAATVRKAMVQINELSTSVSGGEALALNQATRWVLTKDEAAGNIITTVSEYMLCQRVKKELFEKNEEYLEALAAHHGVLAAAVKTKQVVDAAACDALDHAIADLAPMYIK